MSDLNRERLVAAARLLRPVLGDLVFVGGSVTGLLIIDEAAGDPRTTLDVDVIVGIASYAEYAAFGERLRALGFAEDTSEDAPLCRWVQAGTILDVMPLDEKILRFSNRWYRAAMEAAVPRRLTDDLAIRVVTAPLFIATKLEAFNGRGQGDFFGGRDLEDLILVVDGRPTIAAELRAEPAGLRDFVRAGIRSLLAAPAFADALPGYLLSDPASQARIGIVMQRLEEIASL